MKQENCKDDIKLRDRESIENILENMLQAKSVELLNLEQLQDEMQSIGKKLNDLSIFLTEFQQAAEDIASGNFESKLNKFNPYVGALKDLQTSFHHLTWQLSRVAEGDYSQRVDAMGTVSDVFNKMIIQLKERETLLVENVKLTEELASRQSQLLERELENQIEQYNQFAKSVKEIRTYRHDMNNHLLCIDALLKEEKVEEAQTYMEQLTSVFQTKKKSFSDENYILNILLTEKLEDAEKQGVETEVEVNIHRKMKIKNVDWCILFGNVLDNALEALAKVPPERRKLKISVKSSGNILCAEVCNTMNGVLEYNEENRLATGKKDKLLHGIGLKNLEDCVQRYHGEMKIEIKEDIFCLNNIVI